MFPYEEDQRVVEERGKREGIRALVVPKCKGGGC